ncbi:M61 family metallopeptidase [Derxia gummosa]|uniref:M61 family metallopeptidase n=1 Tax=Derxia gummosa DSM 723 TaxID=1121388 RepID=A0A8B6XAB5_9BURK|nr:PDZ domain-containing protein [Derxia gummosa]
MPASIRYTIAARHPEAHLFEVRLAIDPPADAAADVTVALPAWIPGSYMIREFARHIVSIEARALGADGAKAGRRLALTKLDKQTWRVAASRHGVLLRYEVYAWDASVRAALLDDTRGFFNGTSVFLRVVGREDEPVSVDIEAPGGALASWKVATALRPDSGKGAARPMGFGRYVAADYDELVDHPVELGHFDWIEFEAHGVPHGVAISGADGKLDRARIAADFKRICEAQIAFFEPKSRKAPMDRYVFMVNAVPDGYGGLEHRASTALICTPESLPTVDKSETSDAYRNFLGLVSHEYFHTWNVKRIKPQAFARYDFDREQHTRLLWIFEGFTSYYDDLFLVRTGLVDRPQYLRMLTKTINDVARGPGRLRMSVADSSFDAWTKYYRQDENSPNEIVSYYQKGSLVALALDLLIRRESAGRHSLDDVMRLLWQRLGRDFYSLSPDGRHGLAEDEFPTLVMEATGVDVHDAVHAFAYGCDDLPLAALLGSIGIDSASKTSTAASLGIKTRSSGSDCLITTVYRDSAAMRAGLSAGDVIVAINGRRVTHTNLGPLTERHQPGEIVEVTGFRRDQLFQRQLRLGSSESAVELRPGIDPTLSNAWLEAAPPKTRRRSKSA